MSVAITGATGLVGGRLLDRLREEDRILVLGRRPPTVGNANVEWIPVDLSGRPGLPPPPKDLRAVFHLAHSNMHREGIAGRADVIAVNVAGTAAMLEWAGASAARFVLASSGSVYASRGATLDEAAPVRSSRIISVHAGSKLCAEILTQTYAGDIPFAIARIFTLYGLQQRPSYLVPSLIDAVLRGERVRLRGETGLVLSPVSADDVADALLAAARLEVDTIVNIAGPDILTIREIAELIGSAAGIEPAFETEAGDPEDLSANIAAMSSTLGAPRTRFAEVVGALVDGWRSAGR